MANPQVHRQGQCFEHFLLFWCCAFFDKNAAEIRLKNDNAKVLVPRLSGRLFWDPHSMKIVRAGNAKSKKSGKIIVFGGYRFLAFFSIAFFTNFVAKIRENQRYGWALFRKKIEKKVVLLLRWCSWLLPGASGHVFCRFWDRFCIRV